MISNVSAPLRRALIAATLALLGGAAVGQTTLYKWVDERGVVNYGDAPPPGARRLTQIDQSKTSLSVVPGLARETLDDLHEREMRARIERLERELRELREREARKAAAPVPTDGPRLAELQDYVVQPLVVVRRVPPRHVHFPVHARPVHKTPPFADMRLDQRP